MSDYKIRVDVASDYSLAVEAAKINGNLDDLKLKVSSVKKENGKNIVTFSDGSQAVINDGATPTINDDGYWIINGQSTGVKAHAIHEFSELTEADKLEIKGDKGDPLTWPDLTPSQREALRGERGFTGPAAKVTNTSYDSYGNTVITFNDGTRATIKKGDKGDKGNTGNSVSVSSVTKSGLTNTVKFSDGKTMKVQDGKSVTVSSSKFLTSGDTEVSFSDGKKAVIKKGVDGNVAFDKLTESQRAELIDVLKPKRFAEIATPIVGDLPMADTVNNWQKIPTGYYFVSTKQIDGQPSNYGIMRVISELSQITITWETMSIGDIFRKSGNHSNLSDWVKINGNDITVVNNLTTGGIDKALSAEQGKVLFQSVDSGKDLIAKAIVDKEGQASKEDTFSDLASKIKAIKTGYGVGDFIQIGNLKAVVEGELLPVKDWEFIGHTDKINSVAVDDQGNVYSGASDQIVIKISPSGSKIWEFTGHNSYVDAVAVDNQGNIYSGDGYNNIMKISTSGSKIWECHVSRGNTTSIAVDGQGNVYSGGSGKGIIKISPSGSEVWEQSTREMVRELKLDYESNILVACVRKVLKLDNNGTRMNSYSDVAEATSIAVDKDNNVWFSNNKYKDRAIFKLDTNLNKKLKVGYDEIVKDIAVDDQGNVYSGGYDGKVIKISPSGEKFWESPANTDTIYSVVVDSQGNVYSGGYDQKVIKIKQEGDTKITGYEVIK